MGDRHLTCGGRAELWRVTHETLGVFDEPAMQPARLRLKPCWKLSRCPCLCRTAQICGDCYSAPTAAIENRRRNRGLCVPLHTVSASPSAKSTPHKATPRRTQKGVTTVKSSNRNIAVKAAVAIALAATPF